MMICPLSFCTEVKVVTEMRDAMQGAAGKPTVAIITSKCSEKVAVDAMMTNKTTYYRYKSESKLSLLLYA